MMSHIVSVGAESMDFISFGYMGKDMSMISTSNPTRFEKLLGFAPPPHVTAAMESNTAFGYAHSTSTYMESDMSDIMEEDVWGDSSSFDEDDMVASFPDGHIKRWSDFKSDSHFSTLLDTGINVGHFDGSKCRDTRLFSPSQFSAIEAIPGRKFNSSCTTFPSGASARVSNLRNVMGTPTNRSIVPTSEGFVPGYGPRSAPVEVPLCSRLCGTTEHHLKHIDDDERLPPHELLAKQQARSQITAFSVIEGAGRTLKGRDASKVRDAVWKQTGFSG